MAVGTPGDRRSWARQRLLTGVTSIKYGRPPMVSSKRCAITDASMSLRGTGVDLTRHGVEIKRSATRRQRPHDDGGRAPRQPLEKIFAMAGCQQDLHAPSTGFPHPVLGVRTGTVLQE